MMISTTTARARQQWGVCGLVNGYTRGVTEEFLVWRYPRLRVGSGVTGRSWRTNCAAWHGVDGCGLGI